MKSICYHANGLQQNRKTGTGMAASWEKIKAFLKIGEGTGGGRNLHVDALKGIAIIFVVFAHTIQLRHPLHDGSYLYLTFSSFAMPMFMLLSGYIIETQLRYSYLTYVRRYAIRLVLPFFVWGIVSFFYYKVFPDPRIPAAMTDASLPSFLFFLARYPGNGMWFLWVLFLNSIFLFAVLKLIRVKNWTRWENYIIIASMLLSRLANTENFGLAEFRTYYPYYAAGFFACKYYPVLRDHRKIFYALGVVLFPLLLTAFQRTGLPAFYPDLVQFFGSTGLPRFLVSIYKYALAFAGMALVSFLMELVRRTKFYIFSCWVGTLTLDIYVCHGYFVVGSGVALWQLTAMAVFAFFASLALTLLVLKRFRITRLLFLGENR